MTIEEIKQLIDLVNQTGVAELELERGGNRIRIRRSVPTAAAPEIVLHPQAPVAAAIPVTAPTAPVAPAPPENLLFVTAPLVGTFYEASGPGAPPFVKPGDTVRKGQVLCIIESMKLMNEVESDVAGVVAARLVENGRPVEFGEAIFSIRPS